MQPHTEKNELTEITRAEARKLSREAGQHQEPYRGYGHELKDGRFVCCAPNGKFYVRASKAITEQTKAVIAWSAEPARH